MISDTVLFFLLLCRFIIFFFHYRILSLFVSLRPDFTITCCLFTLFPAFLLRFYWPLPTFSSHLSQFYKLPSSIVNFLILFFPLFPISIFAYLRVLGLDFAKNSLSVSNIFMLKSTTFQEIL